MCWKWHFVECVCWSILLTLSAAVCTAAEEGGEVEALRRAARAEIAEQAKAEPNEEAFTSVALGLQKLNPEISVTGDLLWSYTDSETTDKKSDFPRVSRCRCFWASVSSWAPHMQS